VFDQACSSWTWQRSWKTGLPDPKSQLGLRGIASPRPSDCGERSICRIGVAASTAYWWLGVTVDVITVGILWFADAMPDTIRERKQELADDA
jgi:hypothetical protein